IVAPDLRTRSHRASLFHRLSGFTNDITALGGPIARRLGGIASTGGTAKSAGRLMSRLLRHIAKEILESHQARRAAEDVVANLAFDIHHQLFKNLECFSLVFDERVTLAVASQVDAVTQAVHLVEVLLPELVNGA